MPGSGKTTIGKRLAALFQCGFKDTDQLILEMTGLTPKELIVQFGEDVFREREKQCLQYLLASNENSIIATGGGLPCFNNLIDTLMENGTVVWVNPPLGHLINRLKNDTSRPLVNGNDIEFIKTLFTTREPIYKRAHLNFSGKKSEVQELVNAINSFWENPRN